MRLKEEFIHEIVIEKSRFITYLNRAFSEAEARDYIMKIKKMHPDATHHCTAFIIGDNQIQRSNDDGEPSGTAGVPMLEALKKNDMTDIVAIVVRYFGGIKLGAGGLIRAYSKSISQALVNAKLVKLIKLQRYRITFGYDLIGKIDYYLNQQKVIMLDRSYDLDVTVEYMTDKKELDQGLNELSSGNILIEELGDEWLEIDVSSNEN